MFQIFLKYLLFNRQVSIPGIGEFVVVKQPAKIDNTAQVIYPPAINIHFESRNAAADKKFFRFASTQMQLDEVTVIRRVHDYSYNIKAMVEAGHSIDLPGLGTLTKDETGSLQFNSLNGIGNILPVIQLQNIGLQQKDIVAAGSAGTIEARQALTEEAKVSGKVWWIAAATLAVISIAAIVFYFTKMKTNW